MILKKLSIPLCPLRLNRDSVNIKSDIRTVEMTDKKDLKLSETSGKASRERNLRSQFKEFKEEEEEDDEDYEVKKVQTVKKKLVKIFPDNKDEKVKSEDSSSEEEDDTAEDSDFDIEEAQEKEDSSSEDEKVKSEDSSSEEEEKREKSVKKHKRLLHVTPKIEECASSYEKMIQKNREEKMAFLQSLQIEEAKIDFSQAVDSIKKKKPQPVKRKYRKKERESPPVLRKSRRLANLSIDFSEEALFSNALKASLHAEEQKKSIPPEMSFKVALVSEDYYESYVADVNIQESKLEAKFVTYDKSDLNKMAVSESNIAKVTPARITTLAWYPSPDQLIVAAGDKYGDLGIWNVSVDSNPYVMKIHLEGMTNLQFNPYDKTKLFSSSYDGILRCGDMVHHKFNEIYNVSDETCCTYFDFLSVTTYLVAQKNGQIALVDRRTEGRSFEKKHSCHDYSVKTVNVHPVNKNFFLTAENKGPIRLWDLRKLQKNPVADILHHKRCVQSAYFSPVTGNSILATSADDSISIFDSSELTSKIKLKRQIKHNNQTGRWLSVFRAAWLPNSEEAFVIGSMQYPRRIEVFDKNMFAYHTMIHENLTTITSTNAFHPMKRALAGANSSGKIFVFL